jgi:hypothetical protein
MTTYDQQEQTDRRSAHEAPLFDEILSHPAGVDLDDGLLQAERFDALRAAFAVLDEKCRRLLSLLLRDPAPAYAQISAELDMPVGSIGPVRALPGNLATRSRAVGPRRLRRTGRVMTSDWRDDDVLLRELGAALAEGRAAPPSFAEAGRALYSWRTVDAELSELTYDSAEAAGALMRTDDYRRRSLTFRSASLTVELDIERDPDAIRGQLVGAEVPPSVTIETVDSEPLRTSVDELGYFAFDSFAASGVRFRLRCGGVVTPWIG